MNYITQARVEISKETNKYDKTEELSIGEFDSSETLEEFIERVSEKIREMFSYEY